MPDPTTSAKGLTQPTVGGDNNSWGGLLNTNLALIDSAFGGTLALSISGNTTLNSTQIENSGYKFTGILSGTATITWPSFAGMAAVQNGTTGGYSITCGIGGASVSVLAGETVAVWSDGTNFARLAQVGGGVGSTGSGQVVLANSPTITGHMAIGGSLDSTAALAVYGQSYGSLINGYDTNGDQVFYVYTGADYAALYMYEYSGGQGPPIVVGYRGASSSGSPGTEAGHFAFRALDSASQENTIAATYGYILSNTATSMSSQLRLGFMENVNTGSGNAQPNFFVTLDGTGLDLSGLSIDGVATITATGENNSMGPSLSEGDSVGTHALTVSLNGYDSTTNNILVCNSGAGGLASSIGFRATATNDGAEVTSGHVKSVFMGTTYSTSEMIIGSASGNNTYNDELKVTNGTVSISGTLGLTPATWTDNQTTTPGQISVDANYIYVCTATNTVKRVALTSF